MVRRLTHAGFLPRVFRSTRRRPSEFKSVDEIELSAEEIGTTDRARERLEWLRVHGAWGRAVGPHLKAVARPGSYRHGHLTVEVPDSAWKREMDRLGPEIVSRLATLLPARAVERITFRVTGRRPAAAPAAAPPGGDGLPKASPALAPEMLASLAQVGDATLRHRLEQVMGQYLARTRRTGDH
jgi:hypothetical protein